MKKWRIQKTLLIVGEGYSEFAFLNHIKQFPGVCGNGTQITIKNARGKGALGVIKWALRQIANADFNEVAVMIDTDTDWNRHVEILAQKNKIRVIASDPCFEALLLRVLERKVNEPRNYKKCLAPFVNEDSLTSANYKENFGFDVLMRARLRETAIEDLLTFFNL
jgi:hypothetical protein